MTWLLSECSDFFPSIAVTIGAERDFTDFAVVDGKVLLCNIKPVATFATINDLATIGECLDFFPSTIEAERQISQILLLLTANSCSIESCMH